MQLVCEYAGFDDRVSVDHLLDLVDGGGEDPDTGHVAPSVAGQTVDSAPAAWRAMFAPAVFPDDRTAFGLERRGRRV